MDGKKLVEELYRRYIEDGYMCLGVDCDECPFRDFDTCLTHIECFSE